jgi:outer membrane receptor protein involved in Fe transport
MPTDVTNAFAGTNDVAGQAGIKYPSPTDPLNWGVPNLSFSGFTGVRSAAASTRIDDRLSLGYTWIHPIPKHQLRMGGDYRIDTSSTQSNANARGTFTFTGFYASGGVPVAHQSGADFADFLLGVPQQASLQVGGTTHLRQRSIDAYVEDNWQKSAKVTFNLGLRYELAMPYVEQTASDPTRRHT